MSILASLVEEILPGFTTGTSPYILSPADTHPNALANRLLARYLVDELVRWRDTTQLETSDRPLDSKGRSTQKPLRLQQSELAANRLGSQLVNPARRALKRFTEYHEQWAAPPGTI